MCSPHRWTHTDTPHMPTAHTCLMLTHACTSNIYCPHMPAAHTSLLPILAHFPHMHAPTHACTPHMHAPHICMHPTHACTPHMDVLHTYMHPTHHTELKTYSFTTLGFSLSPARSFMKYLMMLPTVSHGEFSAHRKDRERGCDLKEHRA